MRRTKKDSAVWRREKRKKERKSSSAAGSRAQGRRRTWIPRQGSTWRRRLERLSRALPPATPAAATSRDAAAGSGATPPRALRCVLEIFPRFLPVLRVFSHSGCNAGENSSADCVLAVGSPGRSGGHGVRGKFHWSCVGAEDGLRFRLFLHGAVALVIRPSASESCLRLWHVEVGIPSEKSALRFFSALARGDPWHAFPRA